MPKLDDLFLTTCHRLYELISNNWPLIDKVSLAKQYGLPLLLTHPNLLARFVKYSLKKIPKEDEVLSNFSVFNQDKKRNIFYYYEPIINQNLLLLNELTGLQFIAKKRNYPEYTVDALLYFSSEKNAYAIKNTL